jgi:hypothetical protein
MKTYTKKIKERLDLRDMPVEIQRKRKVIEHLRRRELKRFHRWAFFDF